MFVWDDSKYMACIPNHSRDSGRRSKNKKKGRERQRQRMKKGQLAGMRKIMLSSEKKREKNDSLLFRVPTTRPMIYGLRSKIIGGHKNAAN